MAIVSATLRFVRVFAGFPDQGTSNDSGVVATAIFSAFAAISLEALEIRQNYYTVRRSSSSACYCSQST